MIAGPANVKWGHPVRGASFFFILFLGNSKNLLNFAVYY